jgi:hypothetical protein
VARQTRSWRATSRTVNSWSTFTKLFTTGSPRKFVLVNVGAIGSKFASPETPEALLFCEGVPGCASASRPLDGVGVQVVAGSNPVAPTTERAAAFAMLSDGLRPDFLGRTLRSPLAKACGFGFRNGQPRRWNPPGISGVSTESSKV